jgi:hypothetical protein
MTTQQINLAHVEHGLWQVLWRRLLEAKAITEEDLKKPQSANGSPGSVLLGTIRQWGDSLAAIRVWQEKSNAQAWAPTKEQLASLCNLILRYSKAPDEINTHAIGLPGVIMVRFNELWIGIEPDGYAHS